jgi:hypothetical protein
MTRKRLNFQNLTPAGWRATRRRDAINRAARALRTSAAALAWLIAPAGLRARCV